ncbi:MAG: hypothetical protein AOA65_1389 [Candidatus Bathyarchaeota archaeon BA1]|nr:MAG: hypothetical protein AOA65_1389 [Candidatus Bathyarchaeota archaeon BA1]
MLTLLISGFLLGLGVGTSCIAFCAPVLIPHIVADQRGAKKGFYASFLFNLGRLLAYLLYAIILGLLGQALAEHTYKWASLATMTLGALLLIYGFFISYGRYVRPKLTPKACSRFSSPNSTLIIGVLVGLSPCFPLIMAITYSATLGNIILSIIFFVFFWIGSSTYMWVLGGVAGAIGDLVAAHVRIERIRRICGIALMVVGLLFVSEGVSFLVS